MVDENKFLKIFNIAKIVIIIAIILGLILFFSYNLFHNKAKNNYETYLLKNGFEKQDSYLTKEEVNNNDNFNMNTIYEYQKGKNIMSKTITTIYTDGSQEQIVMNCTNNQIIIDYYSESYNNDIKSIINQNGTYNFKNKKFSCEINLLKNADPKCNDLKKYIENFYNEVEDILKKSKVSIDKIK